MSDVHQARAGVAEHHDEYKLPIQGFQGTPAEIERQWFERCYVGRGDRMWQLTWRAVIMGSLLGGILSLTNLYIGLKAGWAFGVAITACILSYSIWTALYKFGFARTPMTILENNCMQSTASSAGYSTGGTLISAVAAYMMLFDRTLSIPVLLAWVFLLAVLGVTMAIPMKRQMINIEQLRFPSGIAAAETLLALHAHGSKGMRSARALGIAGLLAALWSFWADGFALVKLGAYSISAFVTKFNAVVFTPVWMNRTVMLLLDPIFIAAGAITGFRACFSMLIGGTLCWVFFVPWIVDTGVVKLHISEPVATLPAALDLQSDVWNSQLRFNTTTNTLDFEGVMTPSQRDALLAAGTDPDFTTAVRRLYVRSQFRASEPMPRTADGAIDPNWGVQVTDDRRLLAPQPIATADYELLRGVSSDADYQAAIAALYERSRLDSFEPLRASASLKALPKGLRFPRNLAPFVSFDADSGTLLWRGAMTPVQKETLLELNDTEDWRDAVHKLSEAAAQRALPAELPERVAKVVHLDFENQALTATGKISPELADALKELSEAPAYRATVSALIADSRATRATENYRDLVSWTLWGGVACMVTSGLLAFALQWRTALRAFSSLGGMVGAQPAASAVDKLEAPGSWFVSGQLFALVALAILAQVTFDMPYWQTALAVVMSFALALVACRVTGETDTTPVGAMGKIMQLTFGALSPGNMTTNLMSANVTAGAAGSSADLLTDLKSGYLLGANPRKQFIAQFAGIFMGTVVTVLAFRIIVPDATMLGSDQFPAPAAQAWKAVAEALGRGLEALEPIKVWCIVIGGAVGIVLTLLTAALPTKAKYIPSAAGIGLAWTFHWYYSLLFFSGSVIAYLFQRAAPKASEEYLFPVASGVIAGGSLMGVGIILYEYGWDILTQLLGL